MKCGRFCCHFAVPQKRYKKKVPLLLNTILPASKYFEMIVKYYENEYVVQQNSTMLTQLELSFQYRTSRWNGKPKDVDETHLVSEMHWLIFFLSNCHKKIHQMTGGYHVLFWFCQTFDIWYYVTSLVFNPFCPLLSTQVWILF